MKKILLIPFMLLCMMLFTVPGFAMENEPDNFRGIPWGAEASKSNLKKWGLTNLGGPLYWRDEEVVIGGAKILAPINYHFDDSLGFVSVLLLFRGLETYELVLNSCIEAWGKPDKTQRKIDKEKKYDQVEMIWLGKTIAIALNYSYEEPEIGILSIDLIEYIEKLIRENMNKAQ